MPATPTLVGLSRGLSAISGHSDSINESGMTILRYENLQIAKRFHGFQVVVAQVGRFRVCVRFFRAVQLAVHCTRITLWSIDRRRERCSTSHYSLEYRQTTKKMLYESLLFGSSKIDQEDALRVTP